MSKSLVGRIVNHHAYCKGCNEHLKVGSLCIRVPASKGYGVLCHRCLTKCHNEIEALKTI